MFQVDRIEDDLQIGAAICIVTLSLRNQRKTVQGAQR